MRSTSFASLLLLAACAPSPPPPPPPAVVPPPAISAAAAASASAEPVANTPARLLAADSPETTPLGATFVAPAGWTLSVRGNTTTLTAPEGDSRLVFVDVPSKDAKDADAAVAKAWAAYKPDASWPLKVAVARPDEDGWTERRSFTYQTSPNEKRDVIAWAGKGGEAWTAVIWDMSAAVGEKRAAQISLALGRLFPKGYAPESFAGKKAHRLDEARLAKLTAWVQKAMTELKIPGVSFGVVQDGKIVYADGLGVRVLGKKERPDGDTLFMIASNTKALTTLLLGKLVDEKKLGWDTKVTSVLPAFKLGNPETTQQVMVRHLVCACTGLPRQDLEWLFQFRGVTPDSALQTLGTMQPTSKFGEMFQYSNPLAAAGGFVGGHVLYPKRELGAAYDEAMRTQIFGPLGMTQTTFDYEKALRGNHAMPHAPDVDGQPKAASMAINHSIRPLRPAGAAWSSVRDVLRYVSMELAEGALPDGKRFIGKEALLERRVPQVPIGKDTTYGMGLEVYTKLGTPVVHHGGALIGFHSDMMWLPEHGVGAVVLTNADPGWTLRRLFRRKLMEILFDGLPEADVGVSSAAKAFYDHVAADRKLLTVPADTAEVKKLAARYESGPLGEIVVTTKAGVTSFDFGEWQSEVASRKNPDGSISFLTISPGVGDFEFVMGAAAKKTLITRDGQHEYVFTEK